MTTIVTRHEDGSFEYVTEPMSIRDTFALEAMRNFMSDDRNVWAREHDRLAEASYSVADAMMKERSK